MNKYKGAEQYLDRMDYEWVLLINEAKRLNIEKDDVRLFIERSNKKREEKGSEHK